MGTMIPYSRHRLDAVPTTPESTDHMRSELAAMRSITDTLDHLSDDESRARVLRWAAEFYDLAVVENATAAPATAPVDADPSLAVDGLESFFTENRAASHEPEADLLRDVQDMHDVLNVQDTQSFQAVQAVEDVQDVQGVHEAATVQDVQGVQEAATLQDVQEAATVQSPHQPIESMIHSFVADFQKLTDEWQNA